MSELNRIASNCYRNAEGGYCEMQPICTDDVKQHMEEVAERSLLEKSRARRAALEANMNGPKI